MFSKEGGHICFSLSSSTPHHFGHSVVHQDENQSVRLQCPTRNTTFAGTREARLDFLVLVSSCLLVSGFKL